MSDESIENIVNFSDERARRLHDQNEKRLQSVRAAFVKALPLSSVKPSAKKKTKKKR